MSEDDLIFLGAIILLAQNVGNRVEPADESQLRIAVTNAQNLHEAVKKRPTEPAKQRFSFHGDQVNTR
jgi:hypothetical protein